MKAGFIYYRDRCVGCEACVVACGLENGPLPPPGWRTVSNLNASHIPGIPALSWSMACNHCGEAACMDACPAGAYLTDPETGAVILDDRKCIGCGYCSWVCPYDAPAYHAGSGVMTKCTGCVPRIIEGDDPACVNGCPVGALQFGNPDKIPGDGKLPEEMINTALKPSLKVITGGNTPVTGTTYIFSGIPQQDHLTDIPPKKLSLRKEWPLFLFTLMIPLMAGMVARYMFRPDPWLKFAFLIAGMIAGGSSLLHLGRKERAWKAVTNIKNSWLSREIAGFVTAFIAGILFLAFPLSMLLGWLALGLFVLTLIAVDQVYAFAKNKYTFLFHSSNLLLTGFLWISLAWLQARPVIFIGMLKLVLSGISVYVIYKGMVFPRFKVILYSLRWLFLVTAVAYMISGPAYLPYIILLFLAGGIIDRWLFYSDQELAGLGTHFRLWKRKKIDQLVKHK